MSVAITLSQYLQILMIYMILYNNMHLLYTVLYICIKIENQRHAQCIEILYSMYREPLLRTMPMEIGPNTSKQFLLLQAMPKEMAFLYYNLNVMVIRSLCSQLSDN